MEKIYFICIYLLVIFCGGCAVAEIFVGTVSVPAILLIAAGIGLLVYTIRLIKKPEKALNNVSES